jgi:hypothetical protein
MTHNHNTRAKALVSGGCVISGEIHFDYRTFFSKQWCIIPISAGKMKVLSKTDLNSKMEQAIE